MIDIFTAVPKRHRRADGKTLKDTEPHNWLQFSDMEPPYYWVLGFDGYKLGLTVAQTKAKVQEWLNEYNESLDELTWRYSKSGGIHVLFKSDTYWSPKQDIEGWLDITTGGTYYTSAHYAGTLTPIEQDDDFPVMPYDWQNIGKIPNLDDWLVQHTSPVSKPVSTSKAHYETRRETVFDIERDEYRNTIVGAPELVSGNLHEDAHNAGRHILHRCHELGRNPRTAMRYLTTYIVESGHDADAVWNEHLRGMPESIAEIYGREQGEQGEQKRYTLPISDIFDEAVKFVRQYLWHPDRRVFDGLMLVAVASHRIDAFRFMLRVRVQSPLANSGKSEVGKVYRYFCHNSLRASGLTNSAILRRTHKYSPTLFIDEIDNVFVHPKDSPGLLAIINEGSEPDAKYYMTNKETHEDEEWDIYSQAWLIGKNSAQIPETTMSRSLVVHMMPAPMVLDEFDVFDHEEYLAGVRSAFEDFTLTLPRRAKADLPPTFRNRRRALWGSLWTVAKHLGWDWERFLGVVQAFEDEPVEDPVVTFIRDIALNGTQGYYTVNDLIDLYPEHEWISVRAFAGKVRLFGIEYDRGPDNTHVYKHERFLKAYQTYIEPSDKQMEQWRAYVFGSPSSPSSPTNTEKEEK